MITKYRGDDIKVEVRVKDDDGNYIDIDALVELYVFIWSKHQRKILIQFSKAGAGDYTALIRVSATEYYGWIDSSLTEVTKTGIYELDINYVETEADLADNRKSTIGIADLFNLLDSESKVAS